MKIRKITINKYGPIKDFHYNCADVNLFFGNNESGKTALVDAFIESLFTNKGNRKIFKGSERFIKNKSNIAEFILESDEKQYSFPSNKFNLSKLLSLPDIELSRLFIVRAGDLRLKRSEKWWPAIKQFLTNLNTDLIKVKEYIYTNVGLTKSGQKWSNAKGNSKEKYVKQVEDRLDKLKQARDNLGQISNEEKELKEKNIKLSDIKNRFEAFNNFKKYLKYKESKKLFEKYMMYKHELQGLERYKEEDVKNWQNVENILIRLKLQKESYQDGLENKFSDIKKIEQEKLKNAEEKLKKLKEISSFKFKRNLRNPIFRFIFNNFYRNSAIRHIFYIFLSFAFFAFLFLKEISDNTVYLVIAFALLIVLLTVWLLQFMLGKQFKEFNSESKKLVIDDFNAKDVSDVLNIDNKIIELDSVCKTYTEALKSFRRDEQELKKQLSDCKVKIAEQNKKIEEFRQKTGKTELQQLIEEIEKKQNFNNEKKRIKDRLKDILGDSDEANWLLLIDGIKINPPKEKIDFSIAEEEDLRKQIVKLESEQKDLQRKIERFYNNLQDSLNINDVKEIYSEISQLEKEKKEIYKEEKAALLAGEIIDNLSNSFDLQLKEILETGNITVSKYFNEFTEGKYVLVEFHEEDFIVKDNKGNKYIFPELSTGTQDQLMFAVRIAFLLRGLKEPGFFILDDAFLTSDYKRREKLVGCINKLIEKGWQIFYLTIDEHIKELFENICKIKAENLN